MDPEGLLAVLNELGYPDSGVELSAIEEELLRRSDRIRFDDDLTFCRMLPARVGVAAIPNSAFYEHKEEGRHLVRWAFCKTEPVIQAGLERLRALGSGG